MPAARRQVPHLGWGSSRRDTALARGGVVVIHPFSLLELLFLLLDRLGPHFRPELLDLSRDGLFELFDSFERLDLLPLVKDGVAGRLVGLVVVGSDVGVFESLDDVDPSVGVEAEQEVEKANR